MGRLLWLFKGNSTQSLGCLRAENHTYGKREVRPQKNGQREVTLPFLKIKEETHEPWDSSGQREVRNDSYGGLEEKPNFPFLALDPENPCLTSYNCKKINLCSFCCFILLVYIRRKMPCFSYIEFQQHNNLVNFCTYPFLFRPILFPPYFCLSTYNAILSICFLISSLSPH